MHSLRFYLAALLLVVCVDSTLRERLAKVLLVTLLHFLLGRQDARRGKHGGLSATKSTAEITRRVAPLSSPHRGTDAPTPRSRT